MRRIRKTFLLIKEFGVVFAVKYIYYKVTHNDEKYIRLVYTYLEVFLKDLVSSYNEKTLAEGHNKTINNYVWVCWWQGLDSMPFLCRKCFESLKRNSGSRVKIILVTRENYKSYANIPNNIIDMMDDGYLSLTQFSDILRQCLISQNGGIWIDSSVLCCEGASGFLEKMNGSFWTIKLSEIADRKNLGQMITECKWSGFVIGGAKECNTCSFAKDALLLYFSRHKYVIDYFIQNLIIRVAYEKVRSVRQEIDAVEPSNEALYNLAPLMNMEYEENQWRQLQNKSSFFKLTQKREYAKENNGRETFYFRLFEDGGADI